MEFASFVFKADARLSASEDVQETEVAIMLRMHDRKSDGFASVLRRSYLFALRTKKPLRAGYNDVVFQRGITPTPLHSTLV